MPAPAPSSDDHPTDREGLAMHAMAACAIALACAALFYWVVERPGFVRLLSLDREALAPDERLLVPWTIFAEPLLFLLPAVCAGCFLAGLGKPRGGVAVLTLGLTLVFSLAALDLQVYVAFGRHLREILAFVVHGEGAQAVGDLKPWIAQAFFIVAVAGLLAVVFTFLVRRTLAAALVRSSPGFRVALAVILGIVTSAVAVTPSLAWTSFRHRDVLERLYGALPADLRLPRPRSFARVHSEPSLARLETGLRAAYANAFTLVYAPKKGDVPALVMPVSRPDVVIVVVESLREDALTTERMPRLAAWAANGIRATSHDAGTNYSEAGMFSLLYGRSALMYHSTLDAHVPPVLLEVGHRLGYRSAYFSGQPRTWMRMEEFVNEHTFDDFAFDDSGSWVDWDRRAFANLLRQLRRPEHPPSISIVYLMSSHFEYQYPPEYERHTPVAQGMKWRLTSFPVGPEARIPIQNRYLNSIAFLDDLVTDSIMLLDPSKTIVVVTGDHGESLGDDGRYGHGYSFADVVTRVPFAVVGPGISPGTASGTTLHVDLLPTLVQAITGRAVGLPHTQGRSLLGTSTPRTGTLLSHCSFSKNVADALLIDADLRLRLDLGLDGPDVELRGFEDALGHSTNAPLPMARVDGLIRAFTSELDLLRR
jgi:membrane-anchored protein YejM (alkaline phosphatase superfamily)